MAFRNADRDLEDVAKTLGHSPVQIFSGGTSSLPSRIDVGALLAWARALGEFGATLLFAGNMPGVTQTLPLAFTDSGKRRSFGHRNVTAVVGIGAVVVGIVAPF